MNMTDLLQRLWLATLALSLGLVLVAMLRRPWRRFFGSEQACHLWWLPLLAVLASQWPHAELDRHAITLVVGMSQTLSTTTALPAATGTTAWSALLIPAWLTGIGTCLCLAMWRQWRFNTRLRGAITERSEQNSLPLLRATAADTGPVLIGLWRQRIVIPVDFEACYNAAERALILAHEAGHARRRDTAISALAELLCAVFWFHPFAHWALRRLRADQEIACDASVVRIQPDARRRYAETLLKTQTRSRPLPAGCAWPGHPVKERIMMLKSRFPGRLRRRVGTGIVLILGIVVTGCVYAASLPPAALAATSARSADHTEKVSATYQLSMLLTRNGITLASPTVCLKPDADARIVQSHANDDRADKLSLHLRVTPLDGQRIKVLVEGSATHGSDTTATLDKTVTGALGKPIIMRAEAPHASAPIILTILPSKGCSAAPQAPPPPPPPPIDPVTLPTPPAPPVPPAPPAKSDQNK